MISAERLFLLTLMLAACPPSPVPPPNPPDASDAAPPVGDARPPGNACQAACATLALLGCSDGTKANCAAVLSRIDTAGNIATPCGSALCPHIRCADLASARTLAEARSKGATCAP